MKVSQENKTTQRNVFICSAGHSGSTLLDMMIGSHSDAESVGELIHLPMDMALNRECACGSAMRECSLWPEVMLRMGVDPIGNPYALNLGYAIAMAGDTKRTSMLHRILTRPKIALRYLQLRFGLPFLGALTPGFTQGISNTLAVYDHVRILTGKNVIVDSTKHYIRAASLYLAQPEKTRVVVLVRDGRGVFYSGLKRGFGRSFSLRAWHSQYKRAFELLDIHVPESHRMLIHYEDMVMNPERTISGLCNFLDVRFEPSMLDFRAVVHHNVNGNDMKFTSTSELRLDEAWKKKLKPGDLEYFERRAGGLNRRLGYV
jgi:Sulfotransferase family